ncbi:F-box/LRR-repeat protein 2 [Cinnamomum micranthum f. kanehirae]|uniref:F-box/LRR-repeat protein 2 n=1 Tax=Cinnamomum micranthum f. kanehirae TaxID=337451 RepID=A0A443NAE8_9MAGN|nr:F-box/LRR-repeat protein 2 [Cinnamomum micranthum f. kanehirae]
MAKPCEDLPEECWEAILVRIKPTEDHQLESISLVCKRYLSISNRLLTTLNISTRTILLAPEGDFSSLFLRFHHLKRINLTGSLGVVDLDRIIRAISRSDLRLTALDLSNQVRFPYSTINELGLRMNDTMRTLICAKMDILQDRDLLKIADSFPDLEELDISYPVNSHRVSDLGICVIATKLQKLQSINISGNDFVSDDALITLSSRCALLSEIAVRNCSFLTYRGIKHVIQHCKNLGSLSISVQENDLSSSLDFIERFRVNARNLHCLDLSAIHVCDEMLFVIGKANLVLQKLVLTCCHGFTFAGLSAFVCGQQSLQHLDLEGTRFLTDEMMSFLSEHLPHLISIGLNSCRRLTSSTFFNLTKNCPSLEEIRMQHTRLGAEDSISELGKKCKIRSLKLAGNIYLRDETLERVGTLCSELKSLDVSHCWCITEVGIGGIGKYCTKITELRIDGCRQVRSLGLDLEFLKLQVLVASSSGIEDKGLEMIGRGCQWLQILDVNGCLGVTEKGLRQLLKSDSGCKVMRKLNLEKCCDLSADFLAWMVSSTPSLRTIILSSGLLPTKKLRNLFLKHGCLVISAE